MIAKHVMFLNQVLWGLRCNRKINSHSYKIHSITGGQEWHVLSESIALLFFISMLWLPRYSYQHFQMAKSLENVFVIGSRMKRGVCKGRYLNPLQADSSVKHPRVHRTSLSFRTYGQLNTLVAFLSQSPAVQLWWKAWNQLIYDTSNNKGAHVHIL